MVVYSVTSAYVCTIYVFRCPAAIPASSLSEPLPQKSSPSHVVITQHIDLFFLIQMFTEALLPSSVDNYFCSTTWFTDNKYKCVIGLFWGNRLIIRFSLRDRKILLPVQWFIALFINNKITRQIWKYKQSGYGKKTENPSLKLEPVCINICWKTFTFEVSEQSLDAKLREKAMLCN